jgi:hypothetical protein
LFYSKTHFQPKTPKKKPKFLDKLINDLKKQQKTKTNPKTKKNFKLISDFFLGNFKAQKHLSETPLIK